MAAIENKRFQGGFEVGTLKLLLDKSACHKRPQRCFEMRYDELKPKDGSKKGQK